MDMKHFPKAEQNTSEWSGGTTTELYLYPPDGNYGERRFKVRLSTAVCRDETSVFTKLPDTERVLMVLDGAVELCHENGRTVKLYPGDQDAFSGGEKTVSHGVCQDFNLMLRENADGNLEYVSLKAGEKKAMNRKEDVLGVYLLRGKLGVSCGKENAEMEAGDFLLLDTGDAENEENGKTELAAPESCVFVLAHIMLRPNG